MSGDAKEVKDGGAGAKGTEDGRVFLSNGEGVQGGGWLRLKY